MVDLSSRAKPKSVCVWLHNRLPFIPVDFAGREIWLSGKILCHFPQVKDHMTLHSFAREPLSMPGGYERCLS
jgi:hypothetical protein